MEFVNQFNQKNIVHEPCVVCLRLSAEDIRQIENDIFEPTTPNTTVPSPEKDTKITYSGVIPPVQSTKDDVDQTILLTHKFLHRPMYPQTSEGVHCMWDTQLFKGTPVALPISYDPITDTYESIGCFCSLSCAAAYNATDHRIRSTVKYERHTLIVMLHSKHNPTRAFVIAPERECLNIFGGSLSIKEFRQSSASLNKTNPPPFRPYAVYQIRQPPPSDKQSHDGQWVRGLRDNATNASQQHPATPDTCESALHTKGLGIYIRDSKKKF